MGFFDFFSPDELDDLPHEDAPRAFMMFVRKAQSGLAEVTERYDVSSEQGWAALNDARHTFINVVVAAAKTYEIRAFELTTVPPLNEFGETDFRQFSADLDHYVTQITLGNSMRARRDSAELPQVSKDKIRTYLYRLRDCVEKADLSPAKREQLLKKIDAFEAELEKRRLTMLALTQLVVAVATVPGGIWATGQVGFQLVAKVAEVVGEAKVAEEEARQLPAAEPQRALSPPRPAFQGPPVQPQPVRPRRSAPAFSSGSMDDDIPF